MIEVSIIGSGNVAEGLAYAVAECDALRLVEIAGRNEQRVSELANATGACAAQIDQLQPADIYIISVNDDAIADVASRLPRNRAVVVHTAGSVAMDGVDGVLYPMQTFTRGRRVDIGRVPFFVEGAPLATEVAKSLSDSVVELDSERRRQLHLAAVFACNFTNAMYGATHSILERNGLSLNLFRPLVEETLSKAFDPANTPREVQTGAARRGDQRTMESHVELLENDTQLIDIYKLISNYIWETSKKI